MPDLRIRRCVVRVRRRGGWSWGADARLLTQLIVEVIQDAVREGGAAAAAQPVGASIALSRVRVPLRLARAELLALTMDREGALATPLGARLGAAVRLALDGALPTAQRVGSGAPAGGPRGSSVSGHEDGSAGGGEERLSAPAGPARRSTSLPALLRRWHGEGELGALLRLMTPAALSAWCLALERSTAGPPEPRRGVSAAEVLTAAGLGAARLAPQEEDAPEPVGEWARRLRFRLTALVALLNERVPVEGPGVRRLLDARFGPPTRAGGVESLGASTSEPSSPTGPHGDRADGEGAQAGLIRCATGVPSLEVASQTATAAPEDRETFTQRPRLSLAPPTARSRTPDPQRADPPPSPSGTAPRLEAVETPVASTGARAPHRSRATGPWRPAGADATVEITTALPFLALGALSRCGYLEAVAATFAAADLEALLPVFGAALAFKCLDPPHRGWRRAESVRRTAAAAGGIVGALPEPALVELARVAGPCISTLDAVLTRNLIRGHEPDAPFLLHAAAEELVLLEANGLFPVAAGPVEHLAAALQALDEPLVLVPAAGATSSHLAALTAVGARFLTDAAPGRGEDWRRIPGGRSWTNDPRRTPGALRAAALRLDDLAEEAAILWAAIREDRPAVPLARDGALDRALSLAAGVALADLAWTLWRADEPTSPILPLRRFADLDGRVRFGADRVHVRIPLGRRHMDLFHHGCLRPVRDVPWLSGRPLEIAGG